MNDSTTYIKKEGILRPRAWERAARAEIEQKVPPFFQSGILEEQGKVSGARFNQQKELGRILRIFLTFGELSHHSHAGLLILQPKIIWLKNKMDIQGNPKYRALTHLGICSLEIRKPGPFDGGIYTCKAVNPLGEASVDCRVDVKGKSRTLNVLSTAGKFRGRATSLHEEGLGWLPVQVLSALGTVIIRMCLRSCLLSSILFLSNTTL